MWNSDHCSRRTRIRLIPPVLVVCLNVAALGFAGSDSVGDSALRGWFACDRCAPGKMKTQPIRPPNRECAQRCIAEGATLVFIDEKTRTILKVANPEAARGQESHYVEVSGTVDARGKILRVESVKMLERFVAKCGRPGPEAKR